MIFDEIRFELKEHIFSYVTPDEWINTAKVSEEWMRLTLRCIKKIVPCHALILDHLAEFINQQKNTKYTWVSLLTLMPRLEDLECIESTEAFWKELSTVCPQLKVLEFKPRNDASFDWNNLDIRFNNLTDLLFEGKFDRPVIPFNLPVFSPNLEKITLKYVQINAEWQNKIPKSVKHIIMNRVDFTDEFQCSVNNLCKDTSALETFSALQRLLATEVSSEFFDQTPRLKKLELECKFNDAATSTIVKSALSKCRSLETVKARGVLITESWWRVIPENVKCIDFFKMNVEDNIRGNFSLDWLFQNYDSLQSLQVTFGNWTGFDAQKFYSTNNLRRLYLDNYASIFVAGRHESMDIFSDICVRMIRGSHLVDIEICDLKIDESWRHIFPPSVKRLKLQDIHLSKEAQFVFSPQFICENPSNIECLILEKFHGDHTAMDLNAFTGMHMLQQLNLNNFRLSGECLQSILTHCSALTDLLIGALTANALTNIPRSLVLTKLRKLYVGASFGQPSLLLQHFPNVRTVNIAIVPPEASFSAILNELQVAVEVELKIQHLSSHRFLSLVESIDDTKYKYFCLSVISVECKEFSFYWTNSLLNACHKLNHVVISGVNGNVLWTKNYPSSPLLRSVSTIPSCMEALSMRYCKTTAPNYEDYEDDFDYEDIAIIMSRNWIQ